jgi:copper(I)-binding protein
LDAEQESAVNLFSTRASVATSAVLIAATITGCGAGQQSQTATQEPAVNGSSGGVGTIALRDVRIRAQQTSASLKAGDTADLMFVVSNQSGIDNDRLVSITSDYGTVTVSPAKPEVPAAGALIVGKPDTKEAEELQALTNAPKATATVKITKPVSNGLTYSFTFAFERAGQAKIQVPITAGESAPRQ